jgi:hypothetical protein
MQSKQEVSMDVLMEKLKEFLDKGIFAKDEDYRKGYVEALLEHMATLKTQRSLTSVFEEVRSIAGTNHHVLIRQCTNALLKRFGGWEGLNKYTEYRMGLRAAS